METRQAANRPSVDDLLPTQDSKRRGDARRGRISFMFESKILQSAPICSCQKPLPRSPSAWIASWIEQPTVNDGGHLCRWLTLGSDPACSAIYLIEVGVGLRWGRLAGESDGQSHSTATRVPRHMPVTRSRDCDCEASDSARRNFEHSWLASLDSKLCPQFHLQLHPETTQTAGEYWTRLFTMKWSGNWTNDDSFVPFIAAVTPFLSF